MSWIGAEPRHVNRAEERHFVQRVIALREIPRIREQTEPVGGSSLREKISEIRRCALHERPEDSCTDYDENNFPPCRFIKENTYAMR